MADSQKIEKALEKGEPAFSLHDDFRRTESVRAIARGSLDELRWYQAQIAVTAQALERSRTSWRLAAESWTGFTSLRRLAATHPPARPSMSTCYNAPMDRRGMIEHHLAMAERHVTVGERCVAEQRERVAALERDGHDITESLLLLGQFQELQELHVAGRDRLRKELAELPPARAQ